MNIKIVVPTQAMAQYRMIYGSSGLQEVLHFFALKDPPFWFESFMFILALVESFKLLSPPFNTTVSGPYVQDRTLSENPGLDILHTNTAPSCVASTVRLNSELTESSL